MSDHTINAEHLQQITHHAEARDIQEAPGFGGSTFLRGACFCVGFAFFVTAVGLWAFAAPDASVVLIKLGASIFFLGGAAVFLMVAIAPHDFYRLEFDRAAQELRVLERDECGRFFVQSVQNLADVSKMRFEGGALRAWSREGAVLMSVPMRGRHAKDILQAVLKTT